MSGTNHNPYPICIKCREELSPQNSTSNRGWEKISFPSGEGINLISKDIWLCPNCIAEFEHTKDLLSLKDSQRKKDIEELSDFHSPITDGAMKIYSELMKIKKYLDKINDEAVG